MQAVTDEDLATGLGLLADRLYKPSLANDSASSLEIPEKYPNQSVHESSMAIVIVPTEAMPFSVCDVTCGSQSGEADYSSASS